MSRPLLPQERVNIDFGNLEGINPAITTLIARTMFQVGMLLGGYPGARAQIVMCLNEDPEMLRIQLDLTVPLEELGA